jgi:thiol-disulfide isomerase/thioredoxin
MLRDYGVENAGIRVADKEKDITKIATPFIAHFGGNFVVVYKIDPDKIYFIWKGSEHVLPVSEFIEAWTGVVLLAEASEKSVEPDYKKHKKSNVFKILKKTALFSACSLILFLIYINQSLYTNFGVSILLVLNFSGIYISCLLFLKQSSIQSNYADKICSLFKQSDCNSVPETKAAKLWGIFSWSEIGLSYFSVNALFLLISPKSYILLALFNLLTLPYTVWSIWYQLKSKQWCALCLIVQIQLWALFGANCLLAYIQLPVFDFQETLQSVLIGSCYFAAVSGINILAPKLNADRAISFLRQAINALKANEDVFTAILKKQPYYETKDSDSILHFGNPGSQLKLTVLTNLYCNPCSRMHKRIEQLSEKNNNISVLYILSSFNENLNSTNKHLIAACLENKNAVSKIFTDWFEKGKQLRDDYFKDMKLDMENPEIEAEFKRHEVWRNKTQIRATPTVLVNGYQLPENYKIEDLRYFTEFNVDVR